jgi:AcrR family transcriptional regulator
LPWRPRDSDAQRGAAGRGTSDETLAVTPRGDVAIGRVVRVDSNIDMVRTKKSRKPAVPKAERRQQILTAARDTFAKRGYHQTTIDDIVAQAGVARGTFYLYFEDKRAVFSDLIDRFAQQLTMAIVHIATDEKSRSVAEQVRDNIRGIIGTCLAERSMTKILFTDALGVDPRSIASSRTSTTASSACSRRASKKGRGSASCVTANRACSRT